MEKKLINSEAAIQNRFCDLHMHSVYSDGTYTPAELVDEAERIGLSAIALCDHNGVGGLYEFVEAAKGKNVQAIAGVEFSVDYNGKELHILAFGVSPKYFDEISALMEQVIIRKEQSNVDLINSLAKAGYVVDYEKIKSKRNGRYINRAYIAVALVEKGYVKSTEEAFATLLAKNGGFYREPKRVEALDLIDYIKKIGAVSILAHPFLNLDEGGLREFLTQAKRHGLDGMETLYSEYDAETVALSKEIAEEYGLLESGGSDFHGSNRPHISMGTGRGALQVPAALADRIIDRIKENEKRSQAR